MKSSIHEGHEETQSFHVFGTIRVTSCNFVDEMMDLHQVNFKVLRLDNRDPLPHNIVQGQFAQFPRRRHAGRIPAGHLVVGFQGGRKLFPANGLAL